MVSPRWVRLLAAITLAAAGTSTKTAAADPPARVARVSYLSGSVSFRPAAADEWTVPALNYPVTTGDHLWTSRGARTELELGSIFARLGPGTELSIVNLDDQLAQFRVTQGALTVRVRRLDRDDSVEIDTPLGAVSLLRPGFYRIDVAENGDVGTITVRSGEAEVSVDGQTTLLRGQQALQLNSAGAPWSFVTARRADDFEDWCLTRDRHVEASVAARYVSPEMIGYADLDPYGDWRDVDDYGAMWFPRVSPSWAPYRFGHWAWIEPWGWTWIDEEPWGFAPFHYGRWVHVTTGWGWVPGRIVARPVYAPALVAFVGGSNWSASFGVGSAPVAWFPLGPREPFIPRYRVSETYVRRVNITHVNVTNINVTNINYVNRGVPGALTAVPRDAFVRARPVASEAIAVPREVLRNAPIATAATALPRPMSRWDNSRPRAIAPPAAAVNRPVVVRRAPPDFARTPVRERFGERRAIERSPVVSPREERRGVERPQVAPPREERRANERPQLAAPREGRPAERPQVAPPREERRPNERPQFAPPEQPRVQERARMPERRVEPVEPRAIPRGPRDSDVEANRAAQRAQERADAAAQQRGAQERAVQERATEERAARDAQRQRGVENGRRQEQTAAEPRQKHEREAGQRPPQDNERQKKHRE